MKTSAFNGVIASLCVLAMTTGLARAAGTVAERKIQLTGDLVILPVADRGQGVENGALVIRVGGVLVHRAYYAVPKTPADAVFWGYLEVREYKGREAVLSIESREMKAERGAEVLSWVESSDTIRCLQPMYREKGRPQFHFSQMQGWNNDPNGMVYANGLYHLSWQCAPLGRQWANMYWGHAVSRDLVDWQEWPRALRSNGGKETNRNPAIGDGQCFSGSAAVDVKNTLGVQDGDTKTIIAAYTSHPFGDSLAYSTDGGLRYRNLADLNPVIRHPQPDGTIKETSYGRDPKLFWHEPSRKWIIVSYRMGSVPKECSGYMAFYSSADLKIWKEESLSVKGFHECPEFLELPVDGNKDNRKWVLIDASPKYQVGSFDGRKFTPDYEGFRQGIHGNMKAGQCFSGAPDGRAIFIIWARVGYGRDVPFASGFTLPLELTLRTASDGPRLYANPVKELDSLHETELFAVQDKALGTDGISFDTQEQLIDLQLALKTSAKSGLLRVNVGANEMTYDLASKRLNGKFEVFDKEDGTIDLRLFVDVPSLEIFVENGSVYQITGRKDMGQPLGHVSVSLDGAEGTVERMRVYKMKSIWPENVNALTYPAPR